MANDLTLASDPGTSPRVRTVCLVLEEASRLRAAQLGRRGHYLDASVSEVGEGGRVHWSTAESHVR